MHMIDRSAVTGRGRLIFMSPKMTQKNLQFDRCPTLALCPTTSFFDRIGMSFFFVFFFAGQKEKYWEYSSSSFVTYSLLFPACTPPGSDGVAAVASGRLD